MTEKTIDLEKRKNGGQASSDPAGGAAPITDQSEIRKRVQEKIEKAKYEKRKTSGLSHYNGITMNRKIIKELGLNIKCNH